MPEDIPPVEHIKQVEKRLKSAPAKLKLEDKEAKICSPNELESQNSKHIIQELTTLRLV